LFEEQPDLLHELVTIFSCYLICRTHWIVHDVLT
jgi:hypothetical protein